MPPGSPGLPGGPKARSWGVRLEGTHQWVHDRRQTSKQRAHVRREVVARQLHGRVLGNPQLVISPFEIEIMKPHMQ